MNPERVKIERSPEEKARDRATRERLDEVYQESAYLPPDEKCAALLSELTKIISEEDQPPASP
jgi:hypothetical protein